MAKNTIKVTKYSDVIVEFTAFNVATVAALMFAVTMFAEKIFAWV